MKVFSHNRGDLYDDITVSWSVYGYGGPSEAC